jgi:hypothetical protein
VRDRDVMKDQMQIQKKQLEWKSMTVRLKENDISILNSKLKLNGFETFSEFIHAWGLKGITLSMRIMSKLKG